MYTPKATWADYKAFRPNGEVIDVRVPYLISKRIVDGTIAGAKKRLDISETHIQSRLPGPLQVKVRSIDGQTSPWLSLIEAMKWCEE